MAFVVDKECVSIPIDSPDQEIGRHMQGITLGQSIHQQRSGESSPINAPTRTSSLGSISTKRQSAEVNTFAFHHQRFDIISLSTIWQLMHAVYKGYELLVRS